MTTKILGITCEHAGKALTGLDEAKVKFVLDTSELRNMESCCQCGTPLPAQFARRVRQAQAVDAITA